MDIKQFNTLKETINLVKKLHNANRHSDINFLFPTFIKQYPYLYKAIINNYDDQLLTKMISSIEDVILNKKTADDVRYAIDKELSDKFKL